MNNLTRVVLSTVIAAAAVSAFAQPVDFSVEIEAALEGSRPADRVAVGQTVYYFIRYGVQPMIASDVLLEIDVPGVVTHFLDGSGLSCSGDDPIRCTFPQGAIPSGSLQVGVRVDTPGVHTTVARMINQGSTPDTNPFNDTATHTFEAFALPSLELVSVIYLQQRLEPGDRGSFSLSVQNYGATPATNVVLTVTLPAGGTVVAAGSARSDVSCVVANDALVCTAASLLQERDFVVEVVFTAPARMDGEDLVIEMAVTSAEEDVDPTDNQHTRSLTMVRQFVVSNVEDEGSGSLRQAIHDVNALCPVLKPCAILFRILAPVPQIGWFTIQPHTPLPELVGTVKIDGKAQTAFTGDSNADGPEIEINGSLVQEQSGLRLRPNCDMDVRGLAVNGFPGYGIEVHRQFQGFDADPCFIDSSLVLRAYIGENYLGTDPRGRTAKPNQRGLGIFTVASFVRDNLISGNLRSGIYAAESHYTEISRNRIGVGADGSPLGNGAGIFFNMGDPLFGFPGGADVAENVIAHNVMAVARTRRGEIRVNRNSIFDNFLQGIDIDLDAATPNRDNDLDAPNHPVLFAAMYDPVQNATIVRGHLDSNAGQSAFPTFMIDVYASSRLSVWGYPQAERLVKQELLPNDQSECSSCPAPLHRDFEIVIPMDLRGQWITATNNVSHYIGFAKPPAVTGRQVRPEPDATEFPHNTSELSNAVHVGQ